MTVGRQGIILFSFLFCVSGIGGCTSSGAPVMRVGDHAFTRQQIELRAKEQSLENHAKVSETIAAQQLKRAYLGAAIMAKFGRPVTPQVLEQEAERIDHATLMPKRLDEIKSLFSRRQDYLDLYVLPVYVNRELYYSLFLTHREFHQAQFDEIEAYRTRGVRAPELQVSQARVTPEGIFPADETRAGNSERLAAPAAVPVPEKVKKAAFKNTQAPETEAQRLIREVLSKLKPGQLTRVLEWQTSFSVMRLKSKSHGEYRVEVVSVPKAGFEAWFERESAAVTVTDY